LKDELDLNEENNGVFDGTWFGNGDVSLSGECEVFCNKNTNKGKHVGFEVLTAVVMKHTSFWDITACSLLRVNQRFGRTYRLHLLGQRNKLNM
jgi:hypothetical protein